MTNKLINIIRKVLFWLYIGFIFMPLFVIYNIVVSLIIVIGDLCHGNADEIIYDIRGLLNFEWNRLQPELAELNDKYKNM